MNQLPRRIVLLLGILLLSIPTGSLAQTSVPVLPYALRKEIAAKLVDGLEGLREQLLEQPQGTQRAMNLAKVAAVDPQWAANFILDHPLPKSPGTPFYDHQAVVTIMNSADKIQRERLIGLLEAAPYMREKLALAALKSIPKEQKKLRTRIVQAGLAEASELGFNPNVFEDRIKLAKAAPDPNVLSTVRARIEEYYRSGKAVEFQQQLKAMKIPDAARATAMERLAVLSRKFAPVDMKKEFPVKKTNAFSLAEILDKSDEPVERRVRRIRDLGGVPFGEQAYEMMDAATGIGRIGVLDAELALAYASHAPADVVRLWAQMLIAVSLARTDKPRAIEMLRSGYSELAELRPGSIAEIGQAANFAYYNFGPALVGAQGLPFVEALAPEHLSDCVDQVFASAKNFRLAKVSQPNQDFLVLGLIWRYAPDRASRIFERASIEVNLSSAEGYFRALAVIKPESIWTEYSTMPTKSNNNGVDYRIYVRNALVPALTEPDPDRYRDIVLQTGLRVPAEIQDMLSK